MKPCKFYYSKEHYPVCTPANVTYLTN